MAGIKASGIGSGLDINSMVTQLRTAEETPTKNRLDKQEATVQAKLSTLGIVKGSITDFQTAVKTLSSPATFQSKTATVSNSTLFSATTTNAAKAGQYTVAVEQLAQAQQLASGTFSNSTSVVGTGTLHFEFGTYSAGNTAFTANASSAAKDVVIGTNQNSLQGISDAVNAANIGVKASIINDGNGDRLIFSSQTGAANSIKITASDEDGNNSDSTGLSKLVYDPTAAGGPVTHLTESLAAKDAKLNINGIAVTRATNTVTGVLAGVTLNLQAVSNSPTSLTISEDKSRISNAVNDFVNNFNALKGVLNKVTKYDPAQKSAALLLGDPTIRGLNTQLQRVMGDYVNGLSGNVKALADIGITTARDGTLTLDSVKLDTALSNNIDAFAGLFATTGSATDSLIKYTKASDATKVGSYPVNISQLATHGKLTTAVTNSNFPIVAGKSYNLGSATGSGVNYVAGSGDSGTIPGRYTINITQAATQSKYESDGFDISQSSEYYDKPTDKFIFNANVNDPQDVSARTLRLQIDGTQSNDIALPAGDWTGTGAELATQLQTAINQDTALSAEGRSVSVAYDNGKFSITSNSYGSGSKVEVLQSGADLAGIGITHDIANPGQDVAGEFVAADGTEIIATGSGKRLTGKGAANGLQVDVTAAAGTNVGSVSFSAVSYSPSTGNANEFASHVVNITKAADSNPIYSRALGSGPFTVSSANNSFNIKLDDVQSGTISLTQNTYATGADLATEIQTQINNDSNLTGAGKSVSVTFENGALKIKSATGDNTDASLQISGASAGAATLGLVNSSLNYADVAGTIDGNTATGAGSLLTGSNGFRVDATGGALGELVFGKFDVNTTNNAFKVKVDGIQSGLISLTPSGANGYSAQQLAAEIQTKINGDSAISAAKRSVQVAFDNTGQLLITSDGSGADSNVSITQISPNSSELGLTVKNGTAGTDLEGTIGGAPASASGTKLTGTGDASGLQIDVTGGATGSRGSVSYTKGIAEQLNSYLTNFLATKGSLAQEVSELNLVQTKIGKQRVDLTTHLDTFESQLRAKFNAMDLIVGRLKATSDALTGQLANLPFTAKSSN